MPRRLDRFKDRRKKRGDWCTADEILFLRKLGSHPYSKQSREVLLRLYLENMWQRSVWELNRPGNPPVTLNLDPVKIRSYIEKEIRIRYSKRKNRRAA